MPLFKVEYYKNDEWHTLVKEFDDEWEAIDYMERFEKNHPELEFRVIMSVG